MKPQILLASLVAGGLALTALPAMALVQVMGSSKAHDCFVAAKAAVNLDAGIALCDAALMDSELSIHDRAGTYVNRGVLKANKQLFDAAIEDYNNGLKVFPELGDAYVDRGAALISLKRYDEAMDDINKGMNLGMSYPFVGYYNRAVAEELIGRYKESYYDYKHVLELEPDFTRASEQLKDFTVIHAPASPG